MTSVIIVVTSIVPSSSHCLEGILLEQGTSKLEALLAKHEKETQKDVEGKSKDYADKLSKGG